MAADEFENPVLAAIYDELDGPRRDLDLYVALVQSNEARKILDIGCGTGCLALLLADAGCDVVGVDPAAASLDVAQRKLAGRAVQLVHGFAGDVSQRGFDLACMTGNASQAVAASDEWRQLLADVYERLRPGGRFVFETRVPQQQAWRRWNREQTYARKHTQQFGDVAYWADLLDVAGPLVTFRWTWQFEDGQELTSDATLRFRDRDEVIADLQRTDFVVDDVLDAPDRPGQEFVFVARRLETEQVASSP